LSGKRKSGGDRLQERAQALIERGLTSYRRGEVEAAVIDWRHALALDPHADRAREYIEHAQAHRDITTDGDAPAAIAESSSASTPGAGREARIAEGTVPDQGRSTSTGTSKTKTTTSPALPRVLRKTFEGPPMPAEQLAGHFAGQSDGAATERMGIEDVDVGLEPMEPRDTQPLTMPRDSETADTVPPQAFIEEMPTEDTEPLNRPPPGLVQDEPPVSLAPTVELARAEMERLSQDVPEKAKIRTLAYTQLDALETYEIHLPQPDSRVRADHSKRPVVPPVVIEDVEEEDAPVAVPPGGREPARPRTQTAQLYGGVQKVPSRPAGGVATRSVSRVSITLPPFEAQPELDEPEPPEVTVVSEEPEPPGHADPVARMLLERLNAEKPARHGDEESRKQRVLWLIDYAQSEYIGGDYQTAVTALDLALDEAPDSAPVQRMIQERAQSLIEIYASYEGDPSAVPSLTMSPSEYGQRALDSHAAFLLSRVDGMLTIDDLMMVSGMPVLEAHRHLCNLLRQGILTLR
jgi:hypothetical protein